MNFLINIKNDEKHKSSLDVNTKSVTNSSKLEKLKSLRERPYKYPNQNHTDSAYRLNSDLHVELIFLYHKVCVRLLDSKDSKSSNNLKGKIGYNILLKIKKSMVF